MKNTLILIFLFLAQFSSAQVLSEDYYSDTTSGYLDAIYDRIEVEDGIIISGRKEFDISAGTNQEPVALKIDLDGNVVWSTVNQMRFYEADCSFFEINLFDDGYIYGFSRVEAAASWSEKRRIWKIDPVSGEVIYSSEFYDGSDYRIDMADYNDSLFVACYVNYAGGVQFTHIAYMDKATGDTIQTKQISDITVTAYPNETHIAVDDSKNIYYVLDRDITKLNGGDFYEELWSREYSYLPNAINELYIDDYDQVFLFGWSSTPTVMKINKETGYEEWYESAPLGYVVTTKMSDFADDGDYLYVTYRRMSTGAGNIGLAVKKIKKSDGLLKWNVGYNTAVLGLGLTDDSENGISLDFDCNGDVYVTGFYNDDFGPGAWSIQKLAALDGSLINEYTITADSANVDGLSTGVASCVIRDTAYVLGHLESPTGPWPAWKKDPYFTAIDPVSGDVIKRRYIGGTFMLPSKTLDIQNYNDTMYVMKQRGDHLLIEAYDAGNNLLWQNLIDNTSSVLGGHLNVTATNVRVSAQVNYSNSAPPYYSTQCDKLMMYSMNRFDGISFVSDSLDMSGSIMQLVEMESDVAVSYVFYERDGNFNAIRWAVSGGFGTEQYIEASTPNLDFSGNLNLVENFNNDTLIVIGTSDLLWMNKANLSTTSAISYGLNRYYFDHTFRASLIYSVGQNDSGEKLASCFDIINGVELWSNSYTSGELNLIDDDFNGQLFCAGIEDSLLVAHKISPTNGALIWTYNEDSQVNDNSRPLALEVNEFKGHIAIAGSKFVGSNHEDGLLRLLNLNGDTLYTELLEDNYSSISQGYCVGIAFDSVTWFGGAHNRFNTLEEGFVKRVYNSLDSCGVYESNVVASGCDEYISPLGNIWFTSGTYIETIPALNGCDSTITFDITIQELNTAVTQLDTVLTAALAGVSYQWVDCNSNFTPFPGQTNQQFIATANGSYAVILSDNGCSDTSACYTISGLSLETLNSSHIAIYPNPASTAFTVEQNEMTFEQLEIISNLGMVVLTKKITELSTPVDVSMLRNGIYQIRLINQYGTREFTRIVILNQ